MKHCRNYIHDSLGSVSHNRNVLRIGSIKSTDMSIVQETIPRLTEFYKTICDSKQKPPYTISVGSGTGQVEYLLDRNIICVDPQPESYNKYPTDGKCIRPSYAYVDDLIKANPDVVGKCTVLIVWPLESKDQHAEQPYDMEAIDKLKPCHLLVIYEESGMSGSDSLYQFIRSLPHSGDPDPTKEEQEYRKGMWINRKQAKVLIVHSSVEIKTVTKTIEASSKKDATAESKATVEGNAKANAKGRARRNKSNAKQEKTNAEHGYRVVQERLVCLQVLFRRLMFAVVHISNQPTFHVPYQHRVGMVFWDHNSTDGKIQLERVRRFIVERIGQGE